MIPILRTFIMIMIKAIFLVPVARVTVESLLFNLPLKGEETGSKKTYQCVHYHTISDPFATH